MPIYGTRPEAIKMAPIVQALQASPDFDCFVTVTGQHREMLDQINELFGIFPDHDLNIFEPGQSLSDIMTRTMTGLDKLFQTEHPDAVIVQGDTTTSAAGAIAAFYAGIPVVHVEAGLRSGDITSPYPEEANRKIISQVASLHLAPTESNRDNLLRENVNAEDIIVTGNTVIDALMQTIDKQVPFEDPQLEELAASGRRILLVTTHRRENQGEAMEGVGRALARIADAEPDVTIVFPAHRNPVVREAILPSIGHKGNVLVTEPLPYGQFSRLMSLATVILTDSGGIQEEAPSLGTPVLVMREHTERVESTADKTVILTGTDEDEITQSVRHSLSVNLNPIAGPPISSPYGDGTAAKRSLKFIGRLVKSNLPAAHL